MDGITIRRTKIPRRMPKAIFATVWVTLVTIGACISAYGWYKKAEELGLCRQRQEMMNQTIDGRNYF